MNFSGIIIINAIVIVLVLFLLMFMMLSRSTKVGPNQVLIVSGAKKRLPAPHPENQTLETMKRQQAETAVGQKLKVRKLKTEMESALLDRAFCGQPHYQRRAGGPGGRRRGEGPR